MVKGKTPSRLSYHYHNMSESGLCSDVPAEYMGSDKTETLNWWYLIAKHIKDAPMTSHNPGLSSLPLLAHYGHTDLLWFPFLEGKPGHTSSETILQRTEMLSPGIRGDYEQMHSEQSKTASAKCASREPWVILIFNQQIINNAWFILRFFTSL